MEGKEQEPEGPGEPGEREGTEAPEEKAGEEKAGEKKEMPGWLELTLTVVIALAAVGTAWAGFQSAKWSGVQANSYASASATRTESTRNSTEAGQFVTIDVIMFTQWLSLLNQEILEGGAERPDGQYVPDPDRASGALFERFRSEFKPAMQAWLATRPLQNPDAPSTPFAMPEYQLATLQEAVKQLNEAEDLSAKARQANQRSDNYVLTAVLFALVLFFAALTSRMRAGPARLGLFVLGLVTLLGAVGLLISYPVKV
ncbi:hypothetical protein [Streptomyces sp. MUM 178J]|uniref:hypothetical protein n=1 Tax=Streptomyces sp. MUM 178J TaxID=2791991 RepID=UPI001F043AB7|nr:hypothetical protein [Streptomyces sp. MUM 178J]WRQ82702.1 hypothetical protein I3F59_026995 [Streptomyces sp. MUM 178J]